MQPGSHLSSRSECAPISRLAAVAALVLNLAVLAAAQSPESMTIQGLLTDSEGNPVGASSAQIKVTLYDSESGDSVVWENSPVTVPLDAGVYALTLPGVGFGQVDFSRPLWLSLAVDGTTLAPIRPLTGVPYSLATRGFRVILGSGGNGPNIIGGHYVNNVSAGVVGATIAGGGAEDVHNRVAGNYGAVGGGVDNSAGSSGFVGAGLANRATGFASAIAGGEENQAPGRHSAVPGGINNVAGGDYSFAAGRYAHVRTAAETGDADGDEGSFVWADASEMTPFRSSGPNQFIVRATGGIRLVRGSAEPKATAAALQVESDGGGEAAWIKQRVDAVYPVAALLKPPTSTNHFLSGQTQDATTTVTKFHITSAGTFVAGSDIAEALPAVGDLDAFEPGDVLVISRSTPGGVEPSSHPYDPAVIGVLSTRPGFLGADKDGVTQVLDGDVPVAIAGIVPVKATAENGPIRPGDPLTTSSLPGHAMRASSVTIDGIPSFPSGVLVGKAMEALDSGTGVIKMFVMCQ